MKAGVRTFEAAAYLRKLGADTVEVKRMFSGSMEMYRKKTAIIARAELYKNTAIACDQEGGPEVRIAASQAADELLSIKGVDASFTLFDDNGSINISARSLGDFNVQLVMEAIGGRRPFDHGRGAAEGYRDGSGQAAACAGDRRPPGGAGAFPGGPASAEGKNITGTKGFPYRMGYRRILLYRIIGQEV